MNVRILAAILLVLGLAACGDGETAVADVTGRAYLSESATGYELAPNTRVGIEFRDGEVSVNAGCNHLFGELRIEGDRMLVENMGGTEMGCDPVRHAQDEWIMDFLGAGPTYQLDGDRLVLTSGEVTLTMLDREVATPDQPLEGTTWVVDGLITGDAVSSVPGDTETTLVFADGELAVRSCNQGRAPFTVDGGELVVGPLALTKMACQDMTVESHVAAVLDGTISYAIDASSLTLTHPSGKGLMLKADS